MKRIRGLSFIGWYLVIFFIVVCAVIAIVSCTENTRARMYGGTVNVMLPRGQKLIEVTWKESELWYLTEPMDSDYRPKTKVFKEDSRFGVLEGTVNFIERR